MGFLDKLLKLYENIETTYKNLYNMECNGYKSSNLFMKTVDSLKDMLTLEERIFNCFVNSYGYEQIKEEIDVYEGKENFFLRIKDRIILYEIKNAKEEMNDDDDEESLEIKGLVEKTGKIFDISSKNIFLLYAYFLDDTIDKLLVSSLKRKLTGIKYYNCLVKYNLEKVLLDYNFTFPSKIYTDLNLFVDLLRVDDDYAREVILDSYITSINNSLECLMANDDSEYSVDEGMLAVSINYQCLLKAVFALMSESEYLELEDKIIIKIRELANNDNLGTIDNVVDIINNRNEYRSKIKKLSLRPLK